jgi:hypothetical protein
MRYTVNIQLGWTIFPELCYRLFSSINKIPAINLLISVKTKGSRNIILKYCDPIINRKQNKGMCAIQIDTYLCPQATKLVTIDVILFYAGTNEKYLH